MESIHSKKKQYVSLLGISEGRKGCKACLLERKAVKETSWFISAQLWYNFGAHVLSTEAIVSSCNKTTSSSKSSSMSLDGKGPLLRLAVWVEKIRLSRELSELWLPWASSSKSISMSLDGKGPLLRLAVWVEKIRLSRQLSELWLPWASEGHGAGSCNLAGNELEGARVKGTE